MHGEGSPIIVSVSALRKQTADLIKIATRNAVPVFITQYGFDTAVLLSKAEYRRLLTARERAADPRDRRKPGHKSSGGDDRPRPNPSGPTLIRIAEDRIASCDPETAAFLLDEGCEIVPGPE